MCEKPVQCHRFLYDLRFAHKEKKDVDFKIYSLISSYFAYYLISIGTMDQICKCVGFTLKNSITSLKILFRTMMSQKSTKKSYETKSLQNLKRYNGKAFLKKFSIKKSYLEKTGFTLCDALAAFFYNCMYEHKIPRKVV